MPRTLPADLGNIAIFIPKMDEEFEMPLSEERKEAPSFFIIESYAYMHCSKKFSLRCMEDKKGYYVERKNVMEVGIHLIDIDDNIERLMQTRITGQAIGLSFILSSIEAEVYVTDVLLGEVTTIVFTW